MQDKLKELTDKLYNEGLSKGKAEAETLVANAKKEANDIIANAKKQAEEILAKAQNDANDLSNKTKGDIRMAGNQTIDALKSEVSNLIVCKMTDQSVKNVLSNDELIKEVILEVAKKFSTEQASDLSFILPESLKAKIEPFIKDQVSKNVGKGVECHFSDKLSGGFNIGPKDGGYYISLSEETFRDMISEYLRPITKQILFQK